MTIDVIIAAQRRTRRRVGIAAAVVAVCGAGLVYPAGLYVNAHLNDQAPGSVSPPPAAQAPWPAGTSGASDAGTGGAVLPAEVVWVRVAGVDLPVSSTTGPATTEGGLAHGFAHTRTGAVVAALHLLVRTTAQVGPAVFEPTLHDQVVGEYAAAMRQQVADEYTTAAAQSGVAYGNPLPNLDATVVGVRIDSYTDTTAALSVLTSTPDATGVTRYAATTVTLSWKGGDWRLVAPPDGRWDTQVHIVDQAQTGGFPPLRAG